MRHAVLVLAACGSSNTPAPDAADPRGEIYVKVLADDMTGKPVKAGQVVISDPDGSTYEIVTTDATGLATGHILPGGSVTKLPTAPEIQLWTLLAVDPGDHVTLGPEPLPTLNPTSQTVQVTFPPPDAQAVSYEVDTACGRSSLTTSPTTIPISLPCATIQAIAIAHGSADIVASAWSDPSPYAAGEMLMTQAAWKPVDQLTMQITNVPANLQHVFLTHHVGVPGYDAVSDSGQLDAPIAPGDYMITATHVYGPVATYSAELYASSSDIQTFTEQVNPSATTVYIDAIGQFLPPLSTLRFDPATLTMHEGEPTTQTLAIVQTAISWTTGMQNYTWNVYAPTTGDLALPRVPSEAVPPGGASGTITAIVCATDGIASYADARKHSWDSMQTCSGYTGAPGTQWQMTSAGAAFP